MASPDAPELAEFLAGRADPHTFRHADHVRMAFELLRRAPFLEAAIQFCAALKAMTARAGKSGLYHETITLAFLALIAERAAAGPYRDFAAFAEANPDLFDKRVLERWYSAERLGSALARQTFILPEPARRLAGLA